MSLFGAGDYRRKVKSITYGSYSGFFVYPEDKRA